MADRTKDRDDAQRGFSSRWILDGRDRTGAVAGDARAAARAVDTDGDGVADTLALRVDAERRTALQRFGTWVARSVVSILLVAALVAAAVAATTAIQARAELDAAVTARNVAQADAADVRQQLDDVRADLAQLERDSAGAATDATRVEAERDELELEVRVLRRMLLDAERRAAGTDR